MKILITGANGFVGRNLKEFFQKQFEGVMGPRSSELDLQDSAKVQGFLEKNRFDAVINCAVTLASVEQNLKMYFNLERCSNLFGKMVCVGSGAEYDSRHYVPLLKEDRFGKEIPQDIYGFSKYVIAKDIESHPRNIFNLRVFGIYGKHEDYRRRFISNNICRVLAGKPISMNKNCRFDYLYVNDFSKLLHLFLQAKPRRQSYNVCTSQPVDFLTLAALIQEIDPRHSEIIVKQEGMNPEYSGDNSAFIHEFGKFEFTSHRTAIGELYKWYKNDSLIDFKQIEFN